MNDPQTYVIDDGIIVVNTTDDPLTYVIGDDDPIAPSPPTPPLPHLSEDQVRAGLLDALDRLRLLSDAEKILLDSATTSPTPNTLVIRDNTGSIPGATSGVGRHIYLQTTPSATWVIHHNLNDFPDVLVLADDGEELWADVDYTDNNTITIIHSIPYTGKVILT